MEDDLDDLIKEVEDKYLPATASKSPPSPGSNVSPDKPKSNTSNEVDQMIEELLAADERIDKCNDHQPLTTLPLTNKPSHNDKKCHPYVLLGGASIKMGWNNSNHNGCNALRCLSCDCRVIWFDNKQWNRHTDYLFLRNNYPNPQKLTNKLVRSPGFRAYSCQCSWHSISELTSVSNITGLKWICNRH